MQRQLKRLRTFAIALLRSVYLFFLFFFFHALPTKVNAEYEMLSLVVGRYLHRYLQTVRYSNEHDRHVGSIETGPKLDRVARFANLCALVVFGVFAIRCGFTTLTGGCGRHEFFLYFCLGHIILFHAKREVVESVLGLVCADL